jgi:nicotinate-nucleotide pyrophosphorylase (carboxylating)
VSFPAGDLHPPITAVRDAVARALAEDLGVLGDLTSTALIPANVTGTGHFMARVDGVLAGTASLHAANFTTLVQAFANKSPSPSGRGFIQG